ncbi:MAG: hypothetical protein CSA76_04220 [Spirochaetales bacterium]|nr:MAG: hypothetical protein CSA76_04220 [Spirochaetales bacterium]
MKKLRIIICAFLLFVSISSVPARDKDSYIRELLEITDAVQMADQTMNYLVERFRNLVPDAPQEYWDAFLEEFDSEELLELIIPIYESNFTKAELMAILAFYNTPAGKKLLTKQPQILEESMEAGRQWGMETALKIQKRLQKDGYLEEEPPAE